MAIAYGNADRLRNENVNLRAEKKILEASRDIFSFAVYLHIFHRVHRPDWLTKTNLWQLKVRDFRTLSLRSKRCTMLFEKRRLETQAHTHRLSRHKCMHAFQLGCTTLNGTSQDLRSQLSREQDATRQSTLQKVLEVRDMRLRYDRLVRVLHLSA